MRFHRLSRLTQLTQGVALIGFGVSSAVACNDPPHVNSAPHTSHINAPPDVGPPDASAPQSSAPAAASSPPPIEPKHVNSPPSPQPPKPKP